MTLYDEIKQANVPMDHHESDLYFLATPESRKILDKYPDKKQNSKCFISQIDNQIWIDVPFAFQPFWDKVEKLNNKYPQK